MTVYFLRMNGLTWIWSADFAPARDCILTTNPPKTYRINLYFHSHTLLLFVTRNFCCVTIAILLAATASKIAYLRSPHRPSLVFILTFYLTAYRVTTTFRVLKIAIWIVYKETTREALTINTALFRVASADDAVAIAIAGLTIFRITSAFTGAGDRVAILALVSITAGAIATDLIRVAAAGLALTLSLENLSLRDCLYLRQRQGLHLRIYIPCLQFCL